MSLSEEGLHSFRLTQLTRDANSRKEIKDVLDVWLEAKALALLCEWVQKQRLAD